MDPIRKTKLLYIRDNIDYLHDEHIDTIYDKLSESIPNKTKIKELKRVDKMKHIEPNIKYLEDEILENVNQIIKKGLVYEETDEERKTRVVLEIINKVMVALERKPINYFDEFVDIRRDEIISDAVKEVIDAHRDYIFEKNGFNKAECMVYQKNLKNPHFSVIKGILSEVGYELVSQSKADYIKKKKIPYTDYYIKKMEK